MAYLMIWQRAKQFTVAGRYKYKETDSINSVHTIVYELSSFVGNPVDIIQFFRKPKGYFRGYIGFNFEI